MKIRETTENTSKEYSKKKSDKTSPEKIIKLSRHKNRPTSDYYIEEIFTNFFKNTTTI